MTALIQALSHILSKEKLLTDPSECLAYSYDNSRYQGHAIAVAFPETQAEVISIVKCCQEFKTPLYSRGRGSATTGAAVPLIPGLVLSLEKMNRILKIDPENRVMVVEPGVTNEEVQIAAGKHGFFWAPDPSSASTCSIGGNLACNAAGPRAVKYGTTRDNVLGLTFVSGNAKVVKAGVYTTKGVVGYDLTRLLIGSEGSLGVIIEANLKLLPLAEAKKTFQVLYKDISSATTAVSALMAQPITPCTLEFIDEHAIGMIQKSDIFLREYGDSPWHKNAKAMLMIEIDGLENSLDAAAGFIKQAATNDGLLSFQQAANEDEAKILWKMRKALSPALKKVAPKKINEDVVVPVSTIPEFIAYLNQLADKYQIIIVSFGHAGNGNIHVNLMIDPNKSEQQINADLCLDKIFDKVLSLKGTLSGEHGVGFDKREFIRKELDENSIQLMHQIKQVFDPDGILNPGKVLPENK